MKKFLSLFIIPAAYAHGEQMQIAGLPDPVNAVAYASLAFLVILGLAVIGRSHMKEHGKKTVFTLVIIIVAITTFYVLAWTVVRNVASETGGPVHWHADFEIWACDEKQQLPESEELENKIGTSDFHHHNDYRIHLEGVPHDLEEFDLGHFFDAIGGKFSKDGITLPQVGGGTKSWTNGDKCPDGTKGALKMTVNGRNEQKMEKYIIAPYTDVPPGDFINITFG